jgi:hypothetical protein
MSQSLADFVRDKCRVVAVSDAYKLAPWADALVSHDSVWWDAHPDALSFQGRKFCSRKVPGTEHLPRDGSYPSDCNSGLQGMRVAQSMGASRILLLGFDMRGTHFFGRHPQPLRNTTPKRFRTHIAQFKRWHGCEVINCTPNSALTKFRFMDIQDALIKPGLKVCA